MQANAGSWRRHKHSAQQVGSKLNLDRSAECRPPSSGSRGQRAAIPVVAQVPTYGELERQVGLIERVVVCVDNPDSTLVRDTADSFVAEQLQHHDESGANYCGKHLLLSYNQSIKSKHRRAGTQYFSGRFLVTGMAAFIAVCVTIGRPIMRLEHTFCYKSVQVFPGRRLRGLRLQWRRIRLVGVRS
jgi:hypothetical protein